MRGVSTTISLVDQMTAPIMAIQHALSGVENRFNEINNAANIDSSSLTAMQNQIDMADASARVLANNMQLVVDNIQDMTPAQNRFNESMRQSHSAADGLVKKITAAVAAYASIQTVKNVLSLSDELTNTTARLNIINDGLQTTEELQNMIYQSSQRSRGSFLATADTVAKLGLLAGDAFSNNTETIAFAEQLNKHFVIAGTEGANVANVMTQITQALGSGVLRGDELNSVFEQAPTVIQAIADYLDVPIGQIREMAAEGQITADIMKNALFAAAEETNARFEQMPYTWAQVWQGVSDAALMVLQPVLQLIGEAAGWIHDNWSTIAPILYGVAAAIGVVAAAFVIWKVVTLALNSALLASPITWIVLAIAAVIGAIVAWVKHVGGLRVAWLIVVNAILTAWDWVKTAFFTGVYWVLYLWDKLKLGLMTAGTAIVNFMGDMKANVLMILQNMVNGAIDIINGFINILNKIPNVNISLIEQVTFGTTAQLENESAKQARLDDLSAYANEINANIADREASLNAMKADALAATAERLEGIEAARAAADQKEAGIQYTPEPTPYIPESSGLGGIKDGVNNIDANTSKQLDYSEEELKLWRDIAEREAVDKYTLVSVDMGGFVTHNNVSSEMDLDGIADYIGERLEETLFEVAEGVHR